MEKFILWIEVHVLAHEYSSVHIQGLNLRGKSRKTTMLVAQNVYWTRIIFTSPESK